MNSLNTINITKDLIVDYLREEIMNGRLTNDHNLNQEFLAKSLGVSRMPLREALQILELEGTIIRLSNRKIMINSRSYENACYSFRLVFSIESEIIKQIMKQKVNFEHVKSIVQDYKKAISQNNPDELVDLEIKFHLSLSKILNNPYFENSLLQALKPYCFFTIQNCTIDNQYHCDLLEKLLISIEESNETDSVILLEEYLHSLNQSVNVIIKNSNDMTSSN